MRSQPMLAITSPVRGMLSINGRFAGEIAPQQPFITPVNPSGPAYLVLFPLEAGWLAMARRLAFAEGEFLVKSADEEGVSVVLWPEGVVEVELSPTVAPSRNATEHALDPEGEYVLRRGEHCAVVCPSGKEVLLPSGCGSPELSRGTGVVYLLGPRMEGGMYLAALEPQGALLGFLTADQIEREGEDGFTALVRSGDTVGHARLERWRMDSGGLQMISWESAWASGAPSWPATPEAAALAAVEAAMAGLDSEAAGYLTPALAKSGLLAEIAAECDLCATMKYPPHDGRSCVATIRVVGRNCAKAEPLYFRARQEAGPQGGWRIEAFYRQ